MDVGLMPHIQAQLFARYLRGDLDAILLLSGDDRGLKKMLVLIAYDVRTESPGGKRRLRRVAKVCQDYGQRVQYSIFECLVDPAQWITLKQQLVDEIDTDQDSLRFYFLGANWKRKVEHIGAKPAYDPTGPLIV